MTPRITEEIRQAIDEQHGSPVYLVDTEKQTTYVLLPEEVYQRVRALLEEEPFDVSEAYAAQDQVARKAGWDDPAMDDYNDYDARKPEP